MQARRSILFAIKLSLAALCLLTLLIACAGWPNAGHRHPPTPPGMVFRVDADKVNSPLEHFEIKTASLHPPTISIEAPPSGMNERTCTVYAYPSGARVRTEVVDAAKWHEIEPSRLFDFDADGTTDTVRVGEGEQYGLVQVVSGATGRVLFEDQDDIEYESNPRAFPLGDLDGDGYAELALLHPRMDRSTYDFDLWDTLLGARSWITVVSGARAMGK